jgi:hypothetical protein
VSCVPELAAAETAAALVAFGNTRAYEDLAEACLLRLCHLCENRPGQTDGSAARLAVEESLAGMRGFEGLAKTMSVHRGSVRIQLLAIRLLRRLATSEPAKRAAAGGGCVDALCATLQAHLNEPRLQQLSVQELCRLLRTSGTASDEDRCSKAVAQGALEAVGSALATYGDAAAEAYAEEDGNGQLQFDRVILWHVMLLLRLTTDSLHRSHVAIYDAEIIQVLTELLAEPAMLLPARIDVAGPIGLARRWLTLKEGKFGAVVGASDDDIDYGQGGESGWLPSGTRSAAAATVAGHAEETSWFHGSNAWVSPPVCPSLAQGLTYALRSGPWSGLFCFGDKQQADTPCGHCEWRCCCCCCCCCPVPATPRKLLGDYRRMEP